MASELKFVSGDRTVDIVVASSSTVEHMHLTITINGEQTWSFVQPGWRSLSFGSSAGLTYLWSAREIIAFPGSGDVEPTIVRVDEDLIYVYVVDDDWLVVCETSIRRFTEGVESDMLQLGEVVQRARLACDILTVYDMDGRVIDVDVRAGELRLIDSE